MRRLLYDIVRLMPLAMLVAHAEAATVIYNSPVLDKWMYGNISGVYGGTRDVAPIFGYPDTAAEEDRMGQLMVGFQTGASITTGFGAANYQITRITLKLYNTDNLTNIYDPTHDSYRGYLASTDPQYVADSDAGHPVEVFGVGLRNGYTSLSASVSGATSSQYHEQSPAGGSTPHTKNAFPITYDANGQVVDVVDNVTDRFEAVAWAHAQVDGLNPGDLIPEGSEYRFELNLSNAYVRAYFQNALNEGMLGLIVNALHPVTGQQSTTPYPSFFTKENQLGLEYAPQLEIEYTVVPEPGTSTGLIIGASILAGWRGWRRRDRFS